MSNYLAKKSYCIMKPQVDATTPILPTIFFPLAGDPTIKVNPNLAPDPRMKGNQWQADQLLKGARSIEGEIPFLADPAVLGHLLNMCYVKGSTTGNGTDGYTHPFTPGEGKSYTIDIVRGVYAQRIYGVRGNELKISYQDNKMNASVNVKALGQFYSASLAVALTGAAQTSAVFSTDYDLRPTDGLVIGDTINVGGVDIVLTSVNANGTTVGFDSITVTAAVGDPVYLKAQAVSLGTQLEPFYLGNTLVGLAATSALADTAAASRSTDTCYENIGFTLKNGLIAQMGSAATGPAVLLNGVQSASVETSKLFEDPTQIQKWLENVKQAITIIATGRFIKSDFSTSEKLTVKFHKVNATTVDQPLNTDSYIFDKQTFEALYDSSDGKSIEIELVNRTAGTVY